MSTPQDRLVPDERTIFNWIETVFSRGVRRPGYPADRWTESFDRQLGLELVRLEPVTLPYWQPLDSVLILRADGHESRIPCFPLPHSAATDGLYAPLVPWIEEAPSAVRGALALVDVPLMRTPADFPCVWRIADSGEISNSPHTYMDRS